MGHLDRAPSTHCQNLGNGKGRPTASPTDAVVSEVESIDTDFHRF